MSEEIASPAVEEAAGAETIENLTDDISAEEGSEDAVESSGEVLEEEGAQEGESVQSETEEEFKEELQDAIKDGADAEEVKGMIREFELKVNGKTIKRSLDLSDEEAVRMELQKSVAGQQAMQEVAELKKMYEREINKLKEDPSGFLKDYDIDPDHFAEQRIEERIQEMKKSPEQLEREQLQKELEGEREKNRRNEEEKKQVELDSLQKEYMLELDNEISTALEAHKSLPKTKKSVSKVAEIMLNGMKSGYDISADQAVVMAEKEIVKELNEWMENMPVELMKKYIGKDGMDKLRKERLKEIKKTPPKVPTKVVEPSVQSEEKPDRKRKDSKDFFRNLR